MKAVATHITEQLVQDACNEAAMAARTAAKQTYQALGGDKGACGFAWVNVWGVRSNSKLGNALKAAGFRKDYKPKCLSMWNPGELPVQNIDIKEAGADAMATYLRSLGLNAYSGSRLD